MLLVQNSTWKQVCLCRCTVTHNGVTPACFTSYWTSFFCVFSAGKHRRRWSQSFASRSSTWSLRPGSWRPRMPNWRSTWRKWASRSKAIRAECWSWRRGSERWGDVMERRSRRPRRLLDRCSSYPTLLCLILFPSNFRLTPCGVFTQRVCLMSEPKSFSIFNGWSWAPSPFFIYSHLALNSGNTPVYNCFSKLLVEDIIILHHDPKRRQVQHVKQSLNRYEEPNEAFQTMLETSNLKEFQVSNGKSERRQ